MLPKRLREQPLPAHLQSGLVALTTNHGGEVISVASPLIDEPLGTVSAGTTDDVDEAFRRARVAQRAWAERSLADRTTVFDAFHSLVYRHRDVLADIVQVETGKDRTAAFDEVLDVLNNARYYSRNAAKFLTAKRRPGALPLLTRAREQRAPVGVVGQISPWNYPLSLAVSDAIPALIAGNAVVAKPDSKTPFSCLVVKQLLVDAGLPEDIFQVVTGSGTVVGGAIAERCDYLMFTGSTATGKKLGRTAGERLIGYSAELGGKNAMIVAPDADVQKHARTMAIACFSNAGQLCVSIERIYVHTDIYDDFLHAFTHSTESLTLGKGLNWDYDMGSLIDDTQLKRVQTYVDDAVAKGARVVTGGTPRPDVGPLHFAPTVLADLPADANLREEEVFGPVVYVQRVGSVDEAIDLANALPYGLNASVFASPHTAWEIARRVEAGSVTINDGYAATWGSMATPLGGVKESGMGRRHGRDGMTKYTEVKNIAQQRIVSMRGPHAMPKRLYGPLMTSVLALGKRLRLLP